MNKKTFYILSTFTFLVLVSAASKAQAATLILSPASGTVSVDQSISVDVMLNTQGAAIDGVDINSLHYNQTILEVQDANSSTAGVEITAGTLFSQTLTNTVNTTSGTIDFSQVTTGGVTYTGSGKLATITFKGLVAGTSAVTFDFTLGSTADTNVAGEGVDQLTSVGNGSFTVSTVPSPSPSPSLTPSPFPSPSPSPSSTPTPTPSSSGGEGSSGGGSSSVSLLLPSNFSSLTQAQKISVLSAKILELQTLMNSLLIQIGQLPISPVSVPASITLTKSLYIGLRGNDVKILQEYLIDKGYLGAGNNTGYFGIFTRLAVKKYQCDNGIVCSGNESTTGYGVVGPRTRNVMTGK